MHDSKIKGLVNYAAWDDYCKKNLSDGYGAACIKIAERVMCYLDENPTEFNIGYSPDMTTPHGIVCHCDYDEGITGFMAGAVRQMVCTCYKDGWKFWLADVISPYDIKDDTRLEWEAEKIYRAMRTGLVKGNEEEVRPFIANLVRRCEERNVDDNESNT